MQFAILQYGDKNRQELLLIVCYDTMSSIRDCGCVIQIGLTPYPEICCLVDASVAVTLS